MKKFSSIILGSFVLSVVIVTLSKMITVASAMSVLGFAVILEILFMAFELCLVITAVVFVVNFVSKVRTKQSSSEEVDAKS